MDNQGPNGARRELTEEEKLQIHVKGMNDSVNLINQLVATNNHNQQTHDTIKRNTDHLVIMFDRPIIANSNIDLSGYREIVNIGETFITIS